MRKYRGMALALSFAVAACSANNDCKISLPAQRVDLFGGSQSFEPIETALLELPRKKVLQQIEGDITDVLCVDQPTNRVSYEGFSLFGFQGRLELVFYFGQLAETRFHPTDAKAFFSHAEKEGLPHAPGMQQIVGPHKVMWASGRSYEAETLGVEDNRLTTRMLEWVERQDAR